jgi:hypothetical protein
MMNGYEVSIVSVSSQWLRVNRQRPCPVCEATDWCAYTADGRLARCQRVEQGAWKTGTDKTGTAYYLHRLDAEQVSANH